MTTTPDANSGVHKPAPPALSLAEESSILEPDELADDHPAMVAFDAADTAVDRLCSWVASGRGADKARDALSVLGGQLGVKVEIAA